MHTIGECELRKGYVVKPGHDEQWSVLLRRFRGQMHTIAGFQ
ncbi:MAG: hypothetical protein JWL84_2328 [Rhodospirillales bacterium]|nr:hypothetical protein [Rhodospirillales bacterium]